MPNLLTSFFGREREVASVVELLRDPAVRLLTLTGPGGVGKTRLAQGVATTVGEAFRDGVAFVPLAPIANPDLVIPTIAHALGLHESADRPLRDTLDDHMRDLELLLVLDNFEQVVEAAP